MSFVENRKLMGVTGLLLTLSIATLASLFHVKAMIQQAAVSFSYPHRFRVDLYDTRDRTTHFSERQLATLQTALGEGWQVMAYQSMGGQALWLGKTMEANIVAIDVRWLQEMMPSVHEGRLLAMADEGQKVAVVGAASFPKNVKKRDRLWVNGKQGVSVVGVLNPQAVSLIFDYEVDRTIFVPLHSLPRFGLAFSPTALWVAYPHTLSAQKAAHGFEEALTRETHHSAFIRHPESLIPHLSLLNTASWVFSGVLGVIGLGLIGYLFYSLLYTRRHELGLRRAVGASDKAIGWFVFRQFSGLSGVSGVVGLGLSALGAGWVQHHFHIPFYFALTSLGVALVPFGVAAIGSYGVYRKVKKTSPVYWL
jgi:hypothetical protein